MLALPLESSSFVSDLTILNMLRVCSEDVQSIQENSKYVFFFGLDKGSRVGKNLS